MASRPTPSPSTKLSVVILDLFIQLQHRPSQLISTPNNLISGANSDSIDKYGKEESKNEVRKTKEMKMNMNMNMKNEERKINEIGGLCEQNDLYEQRPISKIETKRGRSYNCSHNRSRTCDVRIDVECMCFLYLHIGKLNEGKARKKGRYSPA